MTVGELIDALAEMDPDAPVWLVDPEWDDLVACELAGIGDRQRRDRVGPAYGVALQEIPL